jgi:hypothetical protein
MLKNIITVVADGKLETAICHKDMCNPTSPNSCVLLSYIFFNNGIRDIYAYYAIRKSRHDDIEECFLHDE